MKRCLLLLAVLAVSSALCAQENKNFTQEDVLAMFAQYNPSVLEKAQQNDDYRHLLDQLSASYQQAANTEEDRIELVALAKNFDNSILLRAVSQVYEDGLLFERVSGQPLDALALKTREDLQAIFGNILDVTLDIKEIQIEEYEKQIKSIRADKKLDKLARKERIKVLKGKIKAVKAEIKAFKKNRTKQISATADVYFLLLTEQIEAELSTQAAAAQKDAQIVASSPNLQIKSKNKKPVAK